MFLIQTLAEIAKGIKTLLIMYLIYAVIKKIITNRNLQEDNYHLLKDNNDATEENPSELVEPKPIKRIVFSGGGVKGVVYPGAFAALQETGVLNTITDVAGSSTGSLSAGFLAAGLDAKKFRDVFIDLDFEELLGETVGFSLDSFANGNLPFISKNGEKLETWVRNIILKSVRDFLDNNESNLCDLVSRVKSEDYCKFTLADLALLNAHFPEKFKKLTISGITYPEGKFTVFNAENYPNLDVAQAIRASASLPIVMTARKIDNQYFMDGGLFDNIPTEYFDLNEQNEFIRNQIKPQTLVFAFGEGVENSKNPVYQALYGSRINESTQTLPPVLYKPGLSEQIQRNYLPSWLVGLSPAYKSTQRKEVAYQRLRTHYPLRTVELRVGKLKTTDFKRAKETARVMWAFGYLDTLNFILNHSLFTHSEFNKFAVTFAVLQNFVEIYSIFLSELRQSTLDNALLIYIHAVSDIDFYNDNFNDNSPYVATLQKIKEIVEFAPDSFEALALALAVEKHYLRINLDVAQEIKSCTADERASRYFFLFKSKNEESSESYAQSNIVAKP